MPRWESPPQFASTIGSAAQAALPASDSAGSAAPALRIALRVVPFSRLKTASFAEFYDPSISVACWPFNKLAPLLALQQRHGENRDSGENDQPGGNHRDRRVDRVLQAFPDQPRQQADLAAADKQQDDDLVPHIDEGEQHRREHAGQ